MGRKTCDADTADIKGDISNNDIIRILPIDNILMIISTTMMGFALAISCVDGHEERECEMGLQWRKTSRWKNDSYRLHLRYLRR